MAVKQRGKKRLFKIYLTRNAGKMLCKYCSIQENCKYKYSKQRNESSGIMTRCLFSPNKKVKTYSWEKVNKKGEVININRNGIPINRLP